MKVVGIVTKVVVYVNAPHCNAPLLTEALTASRQTAVEVPVLPKSATEIGAGAARDMVVVKQGFTYV